MDLLKTRSWIWTITFLPFRVIGELSPSQWQITRPEQFGFQIGLVSGSMVRPRRSPSGVNPWFDPAAKVSRWRFVVLPWFHIWWWLDWPSKRSSQSHPGRFYIGGKIVYVDSPPADPWARPSEIGTHVVTPSASFRRGF